MFADTVKIKSKRLPLPASAFVALEQRWKFPKIAFPRADGTNL
jgi:hypothetical protein